MKKITLEDVAPLETIVDMGKKRGLKYFEKAHKEFTIQDLCKHWKISSATFYNVYSDKIGYVPRKNKKASDCTTLIECTPTTIADVCQNKETNILDSNLSSNVNTILDIKEPETVESDLQREIVNFSEEKLPMEQIFKFTNCSDIEKVQETLLKVNSLLTNGYIYDIEFKMIQR